MAPADTWSCAVLAWYSSKPVMSENLIGLGSSSSPAQTEHTPSELGRKKSRRAQQWRKPHPYQRKKSPSIARCTNLISGYHMEMRDEAKSTIKPHASSPTSKQAQVRSACTLCQKRKGRCSGDRPICQFCSQNNRRCTYNVAEGSTRTQDLKDKLEEALAQIEDLQLFIEALRSKSNGISTELFARLRVGDSIEELLRMIQAGQLPTWSSEELRATEIRSRRGLSSTFYEGSSSDYCM